MLSNTRIAAKAANRNHGPSRAMRTLRRQATAMKQDARHLAEAATAVAGEQIDPLRDYVAERPLQSLLIAGGVGLFLGLLFGRR